MPRSHRRSRHSISLFPFLAVLMCTMGALIFLLIVTSRHLRTEAVQRAARVVPQVSIPPDDSVLLGAVGGAPFEEPPAPSLSLPVDPNDELRQSVARLARRHDERLQERDRQQSVLAAAEARLRETESKKQNLDRRLEQARAECSQQQQTERELREQHASLAGQLAKVQREIQQAAQDRSAAPSRFAIVPYDGKTGTSRRPILIEFTGEGIRFVPEDILLTKEDLAGFTLDYNPLLAGARALAEHWTARSRASGGREPLPYILMIVRPSGVRLYPARKLLESLDEMTGYELLEEDQQLALPPPDPEAVAACRSAIDRVLAERNHLLHELASREAADRTGGRYRFGSDGFRPAKGGLQANAARGGGLYDRGVQEQPAYGSFGSGNEPRADGEGAAVQERGPGDGGGARADRRSLGDALPGDTASEDHGFGRGMPGGIHTEGPRPSPGSGGSAGGQTGNSAGPPGASAGGNAGGRGSHGANHAPAGPPSLDLPWYRSHLGRSGPQRPMLRRWGLSDPHATIGFERDAAIQIHADRIVVGDREPIPAPPNVENSALVERVLLALDGQVTTWGHPPENFYWVPAVRFLVHPGGAPHYERLHGALREWGLSARVEHQH